MAPSCVVSNPTRAVCCQHTQDVCFTCKAVETAAGIVHHFQSQTGRWNHPVAAVLDQPVNTADLGIRERVELKSLEHQTLLPL